MPKRPGAIKCRSGKTKVTMSDAELQIFADLETLSHAVARQFAAIATQAVAAHRRFSVVLSGGGTPQTLYRLLAQQPYRDQLPWAQTHVFWGDERCVAPDHAQSNYYQARVALLNHVAILPNHIYRVQSELEPASAASDYAGQLQIFAARGQAWPRFDLVLLGMGNDGHTASLFPGPIAPAEQTAPTLAVTTAYQGRPAKRVTLTPLVFNAARHIFFLATGASKAAALAAVLYGPHDPEQWPAQRIQPTQGSLIWFVDQAAAAQI